MQNAASKEEIVLRDGAPQRLPKTGENRGKTYKGDRHDGERVEVLLCRRRHRRLAAGSVFADGDPQPIGINVLSDARAKHLGRRLNAGYAVPDHSLMELVEIWNTETWTTSTRGYCPRIVFSAAFGFTRV